MGRLGARSVAAILLLGVAVPMIDGDVVTVAPVTAYNVFELKGDNNVACAIIRDEPCVDGQFGDGNLYGGAAWALPSWRHFPGTFSTVRRPTVEQQVDANTVPGTTNQLTPILGNGWKVEVCADQVLAAGAGYSFPAVPPQASVNGFFIPPNSMYVGTGMVLFPTSPLTVNGQPYPPPIGNPCGPVTTFHKTFPAGWSSQVITDQFQKLDANEDPLGITYDGARFGILGTANLTTSVLPTLSPATSYGSRPAANYLPGSENLRAQPSLPHNNAFDVVSLKMPFEVPAEYNCLEFTFQFLTEDWDAFVNHPVEGNAFNDVFLAELDDDNWTIDPANGNRVTSPDNSGGLTNPNGPYNNFAHYRNQPDTMVTVSDLAAKGHVVDLDNTVFNGASLAMKVRKNLDQLWGYHELYFTILERGDHKLDSSVFLDDLHMFNYTTDPEGRDCPDGIVPPVDPQPLTVHIDSTDYVTVINQPVLLGGAVSKNGYEVPASQYSCNWAPVGTPDGNPTWGPGGTTKCKGVTVSYPQGGIFKVELQALDNPGAPKLIENKSAPINIHVLEAKVGGPYKAMRSQPMQVEAWTVGDPLGVSPFACHWRTDPNGAFADPYACRTTAKFGKAGFHSGSVDVSYTLKLPGGTTYTETLTLPVMFVISNDDGVITDDEEQQGGGGGGGSGQTSAAFLDSEATPDGIPDSADNCVYVTNPGQEDDDGDGVGNACDSDRDGDGKSDGQDDCVEFVPFPVDTDKDGVDDPCDPDDDADTIPDTVDNCPLTGNFVQADLDRDGQGDACDFDVDGDGVADLLDPYSRDGSRWSEQGPQGTTPTAKSREQGGANVQGAGGKAAAIDWTLVLIAGLVLLAVVAGVALVGRKK